MWRKSSLNQLSDFRNAFPKIQIRVSMPEDFLMIPMDATLIEQVLINLMENAYVHSSSSDPIDLLITDQPDCVTFAVRDYGIGLDPDQIPDTKPIGCEVAYGKILGGIHELNQWTEELSVVMAIGNPVALEKLTMQIVNPLIDFPNLIASDVCYHDRESVKMGKGNVIFFRSLVSCHVTMGNFNLLNNDVFVGHNFNNWFI